MSSDPTPPLEVAGPQVESAVTPPPPQADALQRVLDDAQRALLTAVLNCLIPARPDLPGAGDLEVGASIERAMVVSTRLRRVFLDGLTEITLTSTRHSSHPFVELDSSAQVAVLRAVERAWPAFFLALVEHAYRGYYTLRAVDQAIGFESRPPQPLGHQLAPFDPALLDQQRQRAPFWRKLGPG